LGLLSAYPDISFELFISETSSVNSDCSRRLAGEVRMPNVAYRYSFLPKPFATAEEHLIARIDLISGEYSWILGDDDPIVPHGLDKLVQLLVADAADFVLFDSYSLSSNGVEFGNIRRYCFPEGVTLMSMSDIIAVYGFWFVPSGFSVTIFRRALFDQYIYREHLDISPIYSHVSSFIECFSAQPCAVVGSALVWYRTNLSDEKGDDNWHRLSHVKGHCQNFPWTLGFCTLLARLLDKSKIDYNVLKVAIDQNHRSRFVWHMLAMDMIVGQCRCDINSFGGKNMARVLYRDSIQSSVLDWSKFVEFWACILDGSDIADVFCEFLSVYESIILVMMTVLNPSSTTSSRALIAKLDRLEDRFNYLISLIYDLYLGKYMFSPIRFWVDQGPLSGSGAIDLAAIDEESLSRNMRLLLSSFRCSLIV